MLQTAERILPTAERIAKGGIAWAKVELAGVAGSADVLQADCPTMLDWMLDRGEIDEHQHAAAEVYQRLAATAGRYSRRNGGAARYSTMPSGGDWSDEAAEADARCIRAERAVGRSAVWLAALCLDDMRVNPVIAGPMLDALGAHWRGENRKNR